MKKQKLFTILGLTAVAANLGYASIAFGQNTTGEVNVGCVTTTDYSVVEINTPGQANGSLDAISFGSVTAGDQNLNTQISATYTIEVYDPRGYDPAAGQDCGVGFIIDISPVGDEYFTTTLSGSGLNETALSIANTNPSGDDELFIANTDWGNPTNAVGSTIDTSTGVQDDSAGLIPTNISGGTINTSPEEFEYNSGWNTIELLRAQEAYIGRMHLIFDPTDITLDIADTVPVDVYTKELSISRNALP